MAQRSLRQPRLRKTAPTVRQMAEQARESSPGGKRHKFGFLRRVFSKLKLPRNKFTRPLFYVGSRLKGFISWIIPDYFINSWREVKLVTWPSRKETWRLTSAVFIFAIIFGILVGVVDKSLDEIFKKFILK
jgi:preprotein translocase SecE subunit